MHELFMIVLSKRDLSRAGDLFSVPDAEIVNDITEVLSDINPIISHSDYLKNNNDQSVVEICVTRVLSCIRETKTAERCCSVLVDLLKSCLLSNLQPVGSSKEDPPHAKIAADIISSIFLNYDKRELMRIALPVAVQFLPKGNKELSRNLASYLSLAAIDYAYLLCPHVKYIIDSVQAGNYGLIRVLTQIYDVSPEVVTPYAAHWIDLLPLCDAQEKLTVFQLYLLIAKKNPQVLECYVPQLCELLTDPDTAIINMKILLKIAEKRPHFFINYLDKIKITTKSINNSVSLGARILAAAGRTSIETAQYALDFVLEHLPHSDRASQAILLHEATRLCSEYPILFTDKVLACVRQKNALSQQKPSASEISTTAFGGNKISGGVTIVNVNSNTVASIPVTSCSEDLQSTTTSISRASTISAYKINSIISCDSAVSTTTGCVTPVTTATATIDRRPKNDHNNKNTSSPKEITYSDVTTTTTNNKNISIPFTTNSKNHNNASTLNTLLNNKNAASNSMNHNNNKKQHYGATNNSNTSNNTTATIATHAGYTRRVKLGDSRSTGRLHPSSNTHRSMTRLNVAGGSVVGLHKSMTRLSSSQHFNQNSSNSNNNQRNLNNRSKNQTNHNNNNTPNSIHSNSSGNVIIQTASTPKAATNANSLAYVTPVPPLSNNVIITGHNKWGIPSTQVTSGGVTVTTSPIKVRPHSQGLTVQLNSNTTLNQYSGSLRNSQNAISVHHASPAAPQQALQNDNDRSVMKLQNVKVIVSGPTTNVTQRCSQDNTSRTLLNANNSLLDILDQRMSTFEPYQIMRDPVQQFCEKHYNSIKSYMDEVSQFLPPPTRCSIEVSNEFAERRTKKVAKLHFACQIRGPHCLYSKSCFTMPIRNPKTWIHLMFLDFQVRHYVKEKCVLSTREPGISNLKNIWQILKCENRSFTELVTSQFPNSKDRNMLVNELRHSGFLDVFAVSKTTDSSHSSCNELEYQWGCFLCNHPDKAVGFLNGSNQPVIEGQLKEKKGKWRLFRRWRTRYFTLSGAHLSCKGSSGGESIDVNQIRSVKVSRGARNIPKAFEIFTADQTLILKPKNGKNAEEWVQCLSIVVAHSQSRENPIGKTNSLPARGIANNKP